MSGWRRMRMGLNTLLGLRREGFFIPFRYAASVPQPPDAPGYPAVERLFAACEDAFAAVLAGMPEAPPVFPAGPAAPRFDQHWFPRVDALALLAILGAAPPRRIVEVGSGHSTRFLAAAAPEAEITCIDPQPRARLPEGVRWLAETLSPDHAALFASLAPGDVAFFDSSHLLFPHTDVDLMLTHVFPALAPGVRVHVHDVFLPDPYPPEWTWRGYGEQSGVAAWLLAGGMTPLWSSRHALTRMAGAARFGPDPLASSLWMRKAGALAPGKAEG